MAKNRLEKTVEREYEPAVQATPARPAYCTTKTVRTLVATYEYNPPSTAVDDGPDSGYLATTGQSYEEAVATGSGVSLSTLQSGGSVGSTPGFPADGPEPTVIPNPQTKNKYTTTTTTTCYPAVAGTDGQDAAVYDRPILGWNAGASSISALSGAGYARWQFSPAIVGGVVGFVASDEAATFGEAEHAFYASGVNDVDVVERGNTVDTVSGVDLSTDPYFYIRRDADGTVTYSVPAAGYSYTSSTLSRGAKLLDATLYASGDYVENPSLGADHTVEGLTVQLGVAASVRKVVRTNEDGSRDAFTGDSSRLSLYTGLGISARALVSINGEFPTRAPATLGINASAAAVGVYALSVPTPLGIETSLDPDEDAATSSSTLPAVLGIASDGDGYAEGRGIMPAVTGLAEFGTAGLTYSTHEVDMPPLLGSALMLTGGVAEVDSTLPAVLGIAADEGGYALSRGVMPAAVGIAYAPVAPRGYRAFNEPVILFSYWLRPPRVYAEFMDGLELSPTLEAVVTVYSDWADGLELSPSFTTMIPLATSWSDGVELQSDISFSAVIGRILQDGLAISSRSSLDEIEAIQYAMNTGTTGVSRYTGYDFNGYASAGGRTFGWSGDGVYELKKGVETGVGAQADFGTLGGGDLKAKHMDAVYLGIATDGTLYMKLDADGKGERVYSVRRRQAVSKALPGRGVTGRQWRVKLELVDASTCDLDSIEFVLGVSSRRWVR